MATIDRALAEELIKGNGKCKHGTAGYVLVRYQNRTKYDIPRVDLYNPDAEINCFDYAVFSTRRKYEEFLGSDTVGGVDILWASERFKRDEIKREQEAEAEELMEGTEDIINELPYLDERLPKSHGPEAKS
jgi:hypothetical protein